MADLKSLEQFSAHHIVLVILSSVLVFGYPTTAPPGKDTIFHNESFNVVKDGAATRHSWMDLHDPPPTPYLPPMPPNTTGTEYSARSRNPIENSVCDLSTCACKNRSKDGKELIDISCNCRGIRNVLKIRESMLPELADTLEIADCDRVQLGGMTPREETSYEGGPHIFGRRANRKRNQKANLQRARKKREAKVSDGGEDAEADEGGVEWEEAVWEAELGPPDDEDEQDAEEEEEEEEESTPEGEESEKGGRYARASSSRKEPQPLSFLSIRGVGELKMESCAVGPVRRVLLEDVGLIRMFPPYAFQPLSRGPAIHPSGYSQAGASHDAVQWEMESVTFNNVSNIEHFSENSFSNVLIKSHFLWLRTNVVFVELGAVRVMFRPVDEEDSVDPCETSYRAVESQAKERLNSSQSPDVESQDATSNGNASEELKPSCEAPQGVFTVAHSVISMWKMNAFSIVGARSVVFDGCHATALDPYSIIVASADSFSFTRNIVLERVSYFAFSITAYSIEFRRNRFGRLEENAMAGVKPILSKTSFGVPHLAFEGNLLMDVDLLSLHPSWNISMFHKKRVKNNFDGYSFLNNAFADCSCPHMGWIAMLAKGHESFSNFYAHLLDDESGNYCVWEPVEPKGLFLPCRLRLKGITSMFEENGETCKTDINVEELCKMYGSSTSSLVNAYYFQGLFSLATWAIHSYLMGTTTWIII